MNCYILALVYKKAPPATLTIRVWKTCLILSEGGIPLKWHIRQGRVKSLGFGSRKLTSNAIVPGEKPRDLRESYFHGAHPMLSVRYFKQIKNMNHFSCYKTTAIFMRKTKRKPWGLIRRRKPNSTVLKYAWRRHLCFKYEYIYLHVGLV